MHTMQLMADVSIVGAAGYTGQETLDRVLGHPDLDLVAVGLRLACRAPGSALDPRLAHADDARFRHECGGARPRCRRHDPLPLARGRRCDRRSPGGGSSSTSRAHIASVTRLRTRPGTGSRIRDPRASAPGPTGCPSSSREIGPADRQPRLLRDGCAPRAGADQGRDRARLGCRRRPLRDDGRGSHAQGLDRMPAPCSRTWRPYRVGAHQHVPEITQLLGFPVSFTPHLLPIRRGLIATCNVRSTGADLRALLEEAYAGQRRRHGPAGGNRARRSPASSTRTAPRSASSTTASPTARS